MAKKKSTPKSKSKVEEPKVLTNKDRQKEIQSNRARGRQRQYYNQGNRKVRQLRTL